MLGFFTVTTCIVCDIYHIFNNIQLMATAVIFWRIAETWIQDALWPTGPLTKERTFWAPIDWQKEGDIIFRRWSYLYIFTSDCVLLNTDIVLSEILDYYIGLVCPVDW